ncbi:MAG TPA: Ig-like domain-containing protein, partial [Steroidobacteraceae bacterium]|nr:Ig-like domain-containing protein [Steroidobacteraceae bacterium]
MRKFLLSIVFGFALAGCGGSDGESNDAFRPPAGPPGGGAGTATQLSVSASAPSMPSDGSTPVTITAFARDANNVLVANVPVVFTATSGGISAATPTTNANGEATANLGTAGDNVPRTITVTATSGTLTATTTVQVIAGGNVPPSVSLGSGTGAAFQPGVLALTSPNLAAGGSTSITAVLQQSDGALYTQNATVTFSSTCIATNLATVTPNPVTTNTGIATVTYAARGCSGNDVITASTTVAGSAPTATATVTVAPGVIGSIVYVEADPENIALRGTGNADHPETSRVTFRVVDQADGPRVGVTVNFSLNTTVGGISLSPTSAVSNADGEVQTVVQGGTVATTVRVTATVQGVTPTLSTQSNQLTITTGIPDQDSFSLAVECQNVEAWNRDGEIVAVTARLSDRFNNPVPEGTAVALQAEGGSIVSQCTTGTGPSLGRCSVNWTSSNPRPPASPATPADPPNGIPLGDVRPGRAAIFATAIGEESFSDT